MNADKRVVPVVITLVDFCALLSAGILKKHLRLSAFIRGSK